MKKCSRRNFLKTSALATMTLPAIQVIGSIGYADVVESEEQYGGFAVKKLANGDAPYDVDDSVYKRFDTRDTAFGRMLSDEAYGKEVGQIMRSASEVWSEGKPGLRREDYAFTSAAWTVAEALGTVHGTGDHGLHKGLLQPEPLELTLSSGQLYNIPWDRSHLGDQDVTDMIKKAALFYGASLVGIAELDERWIYTHYSDMINQELQGKIEVAEVEEVGLPRGHVTAAKAKEAMNKKNLSNDTYKPGYLEDGTLRIPRSMNRVIVLAFEMEYDGIMTCIGGPSSAAVGMGYSKMAFTSASVAEFIRALGFNALPCGNNTGLSVPMAIDAGLGELGRHGVLITPKYGPRLRLAKVITDMPLLTDSPISFGATEFCEVCGKCADYCPGEAISHEPRVRKGHDRSNNPGVLKWPVHATKCFNVWLEHGFMDCATCIRTCPFNKPESWLHRITRIMIGAESGSLDKLLLKLDNASGYGKRLDPEKFWKKNSYIHIKS